MIGLNWHGNSHKQTALTEIPGSGASYMFHIQQMLQREDFFMLYASVRPSHILFRRRFNTMDAAKEHSLMFINRLNKLISENL